MDGQRWNAENRSVYLDQPRGVTRARFGDDNSTRNGKIAVKPGVPYATPVGLNADLEIVAGGTLRNGSNSEVRAVDVSTNDGDAGPRLPALRDCKGEQGALVPREVIFTTGFKGRLPVVFLSNFSKTSLL